MSIDKVFPNPTVKEVIFQIRFPSLFSMEGLIGTFQTKVMDKFPVAKLVLKKQVLFGTIQDQVQSKQASEQHDISDVKKIWQFTSESGVILNVEVDSLALSSNVHKTYNNPKGKERFRETIEFVLSHFFEVTQIPKVNRIGLRYIDECPVPSKSNVTFLKYYNTSLPIQRFKLKDAIEMAFMVRVRKGKHFLTFRESLNEVTEKLVLNLDFDGYAQNIKSSDCLTVTDKLHDLISNEYESIIKEPVYRYMRKKGVKK